MAIVVVLGTAGIVYSRDQRQPDTTRPQPSDHWHAAIGFYICGSFVPNLPEGDDPLGIHGHSDNIVHIHPFGASSSGKRATLDIWFDTVGAEVSEDRIELPGQETKTNGDSCENGEGVVRTKVWDTRDPNDQGRIVEGDPSNIRPQDGQLITIAFGPPDQEIPRPPSEPTLDNLSDVPGATTTTSVAPTTSSSTSTTTASTTTSTSTP